jgi:hypothetical protein
VHCDWAQDEKAGATARFNRDYLKSFFKDRELLEINPTTPALS